MTELVFLGIGAIRPALAGDHTALLLRHGGANVLLDAGPGVLIQLDRVGVIPTEISHVYFSHQHGDHTLGSPLLLFYRRPRIFLSAPEVLKAWRQLLDLVYPGYVEVLAKELKFQPLPVKQSHTWPDLPGVTAKLAEAYHVNLPAYALRLDFAPEPGSEPSSGFSMVYSGDTAPTESVEQLAQGVDLLIHEATYLTCEQSEGKGIHSSAGNAGEIANAAGVKCLALVHRLPGEPERWREEAAKVYDGPILVPMAGDTITLVGKGTS